MAQKIIQMQMRHLYFNLKDLFSNRKGFVILTSLLRFKNKSREFREYTSRFLLTGYLQVSYNAVPMWLILQVGVPLRVL